MVQVNVHAVAVDSDGKPVLILKPVNEPPGQGVLLPIWIGPAEATAILVASEASPLPPRPLAYDLMARLLDASHATVEQVEVSRLEDGTFYASITLSTPDTVQSLRSAAPARRSPLSRARITLARQRSS